MNSKNIEKSRNNHWHRWKFWILFAVTPDPRHYIQAIYSIVGFQFQLSKITIIVGLLSLFTLMVIIFTRRFKLKTVVAFILIGCVCWYPVIIEIHFIPPGHRGEWNLINLCELFYLRSRYFISVAIVMNAAESGVYHLANLNQSYGNVMVRIQLEIVNRHYCFHILPICWISELHRRLYCRKPLP